MLLPQIIHMLQMLGLLALQVLFLNHICLFGYATPFVTVAFLLYFPLNASRSGLLVWAFSMGLLSDVFSNTPGIGAAAMTFAAMFRPFLLRVLVSKDVAEEMLPTYFSMGKWAHVRLVFGLLVLHHLVYFVLESFSTAHIMDVLLSFFGSLVLSMLVILIIERFRYSTK